MPARPAKRRPGRPAHPIGREELLAVARRIFATEGYGSASLSQIAEGAGLRKASLYHHFASKEAMYLAVLDEVTRDLARFIEQALVSAGDHAETLDRLGAQIVDYFGNNPQAAKLLIRELLGHGPWMQRGGREAVQKTLELAAAFLEAGMKAGAFCPRDPRQLAFSIASVHMLYFATGAVADDFIGGDVFSKDLLEARKAALLEQVRALCLR